MKLASVVLVTAVIGLGVGIIVWSQMGEHSVSVQEEQIAAAANNSIVTAAGTKPAAQPVATQDKAPAEPASKVEPASKLTDTAIKTRVESVPAPKISDTKEADVAKPVPQLDQAVASELKSSVENQFIQKLSFPLTEAKMIAFAQASMRVRRINNKWDVQIAGAETDAMAIEYNNFAIEEITGAMAKIPGLTLDEYNEMTKLTAIDPDFNRIYQVYKQLVNEGYFKDRSGIAPLAPSATPSGPLTPEEMAAPTDPTKTTIPGNPAAPAMTPAPAEVTPSVAPAPAAGTAPVTQGSTTPPYSPPVSR